MGRPRFSRLRRSWRKLALILTIEVDRIMTKDLAYACGRKDGWVFRRVYMEAVEKRLEGLLEE